MVYPIWFRRFTRCINWIHRGWRLISYHISTWGFCFADFPWCVHARFMKNTTRETQSAGIGFTLFGNSNCSFQVDLDGQVETKQNASGPILFSQGGLSLDLHYVTLTSGALEGSTQQLALNAITVRYDRDDVSVSNRYL